MGPTEVVGTANKPHPSEPSISTEWEACRHRRVKLASRSRNVPLIRSIQEVCKPVPLFLSRREAGGLVPPDRCRHPTNHFDHLLALGPFDTRAAEHTWPCQKPTPSLSSKASSFARDTRVAYAWERQPTHQSQRAGLAEASTTASPDGTRHRPDGDARCSDTPPPSHKRVLSWLAIAIQGIVRQALTRMRIGWHLVSIEVLWHSSFFMHLLALVSGLLRPSSDGLAISVISVNHGLEGASRSKPRDDSHDQLDRRGFALQPWSLAWLSRSSGRPSSAHEMRNELVEELIVDL